MATEDPEIKLANGPNFACKFPPTDARSAPLHALVFTGARAREDMRRHAPGATFLNLSDLPLTTQVVTNKLPGVVTSTTRGTHTGVHFFDL